MPIIVSNTEIFRFEIIMNISIPTITYDFKYLSLMLEYILIIMNVNVFVYWLLLNICYYSTLRFMKNSQSNPKPKSEEHIHKSKPNIITSSIIPSVVGAWIWLTLVAFINKNRKKIIRRISSTVDKQISSLHHPHYARRLEIALLNKANIRRLANSSHNMAKLAWPDSEVTRFEYIADAFSKSTLPQIVKDSMPFLVLQESNYNPSAYSKSWALGCWQFLANTGIAFGLKPEQRTDFIASTDAAVRYFEYIYQVITSDEHYINLVQRYGIKDSLFASLLTINAFNSGEWNMLIALDIMDTNPNERRNVDNYASYGSNGLFTYISCYLASDETYRKLQWPYHTWSRSNFPYYRSESSSYCFQIEAFRKLYSKEIISTPIVKTIEVEIYLTLWRMRSAIIWLLGWLVSYATITYAWNNRITRRGFFKAVIAWFAWSISWYIHALSQETQIPINSFPFHNISKDPSTLAVTNLKRLKSKELSRYLNELTLINARAKSNKKFVHDPNMINSKNYPFNQRMWDAAYSIYRETSENIYLRISEYYYQRSLNLAIQQKAWKFKWPEWGLEQIEARIRFCKRSLEAISDVAQFH